MQFYGLNFVVCSNSRLKVKTRLLYIRNVVCPWCIAILSVLWFFTLTVLILRQKWTMSSHTIWHACEFVIFGAPPKADEFVTSSHSIYIFHFGQYLFSSRRAAFEHGSRPFQLRCLQQHRTLSAHITNKWDFLEGKRMMLQKIKQFIRVQFFTVSQRDRVS